MSFLATIGGIIADSIVKKVETRLDSLFRKKDNFDQMSKEKNEKALELKEMVKLANTEEERDVLLDKMDELFRSNISPR